MTKQSSKKQPSSGRRKSSRKRQKKTHTWVRAALYAVLLAAAAAAGYFYGYSRAQTRYLEALNTEKARSYDLACSLKEARAKTARHEYEKQPPKPPKRPEKSDQRAKRPMLAIIIDDVSFAHDVRHIEALHLPLTMSFLPPSPRHPDSARLAAKAPFYMVHLPLEAMAFSAEEPKTLHTGDSAEVIDARVREIKRLFPKVRYVNNHTGSRFTSDATAMQRLISALDREGITFIDSRTTAKTAVPALMKALHRPYLARDVFLDHDPDIDAVKKQIARAVALAKKHGFAVAIGHPHKMTLAALAASKALLSQVRLVRIDVLAKSLQR